MATEIKLRRGTKAQHDDGSGFTGALGEVTVDTTDDTLRVHDGSLKGGHVIAKLSDVEASDTLSELLAKGNATSGTNLQISPSDDLLVSDTSKLKFETDGSNYLQIYKSSGTSGTSYIHEVGGGALVIKGESGYLRNDNDESQVTWNANGVTLGYNGSGVLDTTSTGINVTGTVDCDGLSLGDNEKIQLGASQDLEIFHDGTNSYLQDVGDGQLILNTTNGGGVYVQSAGETMAQFISNGAVNLYHDNAQKFATTETGIDVTGAITVSGNVDGRDIAADGLVLDAIEAGADVTDTVNVVDALTAGDNITIEADGTITATDTNTTYSVQDGELSQNNFTNDDHLKLNGIAASADVTDTTKVVAALTEGTNIDIAGNGTISATNTEYTGGTGLTLDGTTFNVDAAQTHITSVGALDAGSITSGFGNINNGSNSITTLGNLYAGSTALGATTINGNLEVISTIADSNFLPEIRLKRAGGVDAGEDGDVLGALVFEGDSFDGSQKDYARIGVAIKDDGTGVTGGQVEGEIRFACADGDGGSPALEIPSARIDSQGIHTNESIIDGTGNKNFFHTHNCGSGGGLKFHSNDGNHTTTIKAKNPSADQDITIPNVTGDIVVASIAGGSINGGGDTTTPRTTWSISQFVANPNSTYMHFNDGNTNDLTISVPFVGVDAVTIGSSFKFINASPSDSDIIIDIDGFTFAGTAAYALTKLDGSSNSVIYSNGSNLTIDSGGQITLTAVSAGVWLVEGIGYS